MSPRFEKRDVARGSARRRAGDDWTHQLLLNDPAKGDKGFTPAVFAQQTIAAFKERTGHDLVSLSTATVPEMAKPLLERLLEESKKTGLMDQMVINMPGIKYKGLIPATFGTETGARFQSWSGVDPKQTAPDHLLRNPRRTSRTHLKRLR